MQNMEGNFDESFKTIKPNAKSLLDKSGSGPGKSPAYLTGSVLALVTWSQREDPHWFGGRIPDNSQSVEFVRTGASGRAGSYRCYDGPLLTEHTFNTEEAAKRSSFLLNLAPATLP